MSDTEKQGFRAVEANVEEMEKKIRRHRKRIALSIASGLCSQFRGGTGRKCVRKV